jgi:hypothetical protein
MSETWVDAMDADNYEVSGEGIYDSEGVGEGFFDSEGTGEGTFGYGEESRSDRSRRERQRQIMLERQRQRQVQTRQRRSPAQRPSPARGPARAPGPSPRQTITAIRSLDLETKVDLDSLRRKLEESSRRASRATWAAVASAAVDQGLSSFGDDLKNHQYVAAGARFAPLLFLSPEKKKAGIEGFATDPRVIGGAAILGIALLGNFRNKAHEVSTVSIVPPGRITTSGTLTADTLDRNGNTVPNTSITWSSSDPAVLTFPNTSSGAFTVTAGKKETVQVTAKANGITSRINVKVKSP